MKIHTVSAMKSVTWRLIATATTTLLVYLFTGKVKLALEVGAVEVLAKVLFYYLHERAWNRISPACQTDGYAPINGNKTIPAKQS